MKFPEIAEKIANNFILRYCFSGASDIYNIVLYISGARQTCLAATVKTTLSPFYVPVSRWANVITERLHASRSRNFLNVAISHAANHRLFRRGDVSADTLSLFTEMRERPVKSEFGT